MGFYGKITNTSKSQFSFDIIYPNRREMDMQADNDGIYVGRYVLVEYEDNSFYTPAYIVNRTAHGVDINGGTVTVPEKNEVTIPSLTQNSNGDSLVSKEQGEYCWVPAENHLIGKKSSTMYKVLAYYSKPLSYAEGQVYWVYSIKQKKWVEQIGVKEEAWKAHPDIYYIKSSDEDFETVRSNASLIEFIVAPGTSRDQTDYVRNFNIDKNYCENELKVTFARGYDSTVWQKTFVSGQPKYVMIAELNSVVPTFDMAIDAPTETAPLMPYFDQDSTNVYYKLHWQPQWNFRIKPQNQLKEYRWENGAPSGDVVQEFQNRENSVPSDEFVEYSRVEHNNTNGNKKYYYNYANGNDATWVDKNDDVGNNYKVPAAIYYNAAGFDAGTEVKSIYGNDEITLSSTGVSGHTYGGKAQEDIKELSLKLPSIGDSISSMWDVIYGPASLNTTGEEWVDSGDLNRGRWIDSENYFDQDGTRITEFYVYNTITRSYEQISVSEKGKIIKADYDNAAINYGKKPEYLAKVVNGERKAIIYFYTQGQQIYRPNEILENRGFQGENNFPARNTNIGWGNFDGLRLPLTKNSYTWKQGEANLSTAAGTINTVHDLLGQIIISVDDIYYDNYPFDENNKFVLKNSAEEIARELADYYHIYYVCINVEEIANRWTEGKVVGGAEEWRNFKHANGTYKFCRKAPLFQFTLADNNSKKPEEIKLYEDTYEFVEALGVDKNSYLPGYYYKKEGGKFVVAEEEIFNEVTTYFVRRIKQNQLSFDNYVRENDIDDERTVGYKLIQYAPYKYYYKTEFDGYTLSDYAENEIPNLDGSLTYYDLAEAITQKNVLYSIENSYTNWGTLTLNTSGQEIYYKDPNGVFDSNVTYYEYKQETDSFIKKIVESNTYEAGKFYLKALNYNYITEEEKTYEGLNKAGAPNHYIISNEEGGRVPVKNETVKYIWAPNVYFKKVQLPDDKKYYYYFAESEQPDPGTTYYYFSKAFQEKNIDIDTSNQEVMVINQNDAETIVGDEGKAIAFNEFVVPNLKGANWYYYDDKTRSHYQIFRKPNSNIYYYVNNLGETKDLVIANEPNSDSNNIYALKPKLVDVKNDLYYSKRFYESDDDLGLAENGNPYHMRIARKEWDEGDSGRTGRSYYYIDQEKVKIIDDDNLDFKDGEAYSPKYLGKFYSPNKYYVNVGGADSPDMVLDSGKRLDPDKKYYSFNDFYIWEDKLNLYKGIMRNAEGDGNISGALWNTNIKFVPASITLAKRQSKHEFKSLEGFGRDVNTINGLIVKINQMLEFPELAGTATEDNNGLTRNPNTVQGCINLINDIVSKFVNTTPGDLVVVDAYGRYHSAKPSTDQKFSIGSFDSNGDKWTDKNEYSTEDQWIKIKIDDNPIKPNLRVAHTLLDEKIIKLDEYGKPIINPDGTYETVTHRVKDEEDNPINLNDQKKDAIDLISPIVDRAGHVVGRRINTTTLPYGFNSIKAGQQSITATQVYDTLSIKGEGGIELIPTSSGKNKEITIRYNGYGETPIATYEKAGVVKPDVETMELTLVDGTIKPRIATYQKAGIVKPDGRTINILPDGTISAIGGSSSSAVETVVNTGVKNANGTYSTYDSISRTLTLNQGHYAKVFIGTEKEVATAEGAYLWLDVTNPNDVIMKVPDKMTYNEGKISVTTWMPLNRWF